jgi:hypothetical protein
LPIHLSSPKKSNIQKNIDPSAANAGVGLEVAMLILVSPLAGAKSVRTRNE